MADTGFDIREASWEADAEALRMIREAVFIDEQGVPPELEWDDDDRECRHLLALDAVGQPIATARLHPDGRIGRMAVLADWRGHGVGTALLRALLALARDEGLTEVRLNAQTHVVEFYRGHGFRAEGEVFLDAGIPHRLMRCRLGNSRD